MYVDIHCYLQLASIHLAASVENTQFDPACIVNSLIVRHRLKYVLCSFKHRCVPFTGPIGVTTTGPHTAGKGICNSKHCVYTVLPDKTHKKGDIYVQFVLAFES